MSNRRTENIEPGIRWLGKKRTKIQAYVTVAGAKVFSVPAFDIADGGYALALERARAWRRARMKAATSAGRPGSFATDIAAHLIQVRARPTLKQITAHLARWAEALGKDRLSNSITTAEINAVMQDWLLTPTAPDYAKGERGRPSAAHGLDKQTVRKRRSTLRTFFAVLNGPDGYNPVQHAQQFKAPPAAPRSLDYRTVGRILAAMPDYQTPPRGELPTDPSLAKLRATVIAYTGLPPGMIKRLTRPAVAAVLRGEKLSVPRREKGGGVEPRDLPLLPAGVAALRAFDAANAYGDFAEQNVNLAFQRAAKRIGITGVTLYWLRHSFGTELYATTKDQATVARMMLHAEGSPITARYTKSAHAAVDEAAIAAMDQRLRRLARPAAAIVPLTPRQSHTSAARVSRKVITRPGRFTAEKR